MKVGNLLKGAALCSLLLPLTLAAEPLRVMTSFTILQDLTRQIAGEHARVDTLVGPNADAHAFEPAPRHARALREADLIIINGLEFEGWIERLISASGFAGTMVRASAGVNALDMDDHDDHDDHRDGDGDDNHDHQAAHDSHDHGHDNHGHGDEHGHDKDGHGHDHHARHDDHADHADHDDHDDHKHHGEHDSHAKDDHGHGGHDHGHGEYDPHVWHDVNRVRTYVRNIADALAERAPEHAADFTRRAADLDGRLQQLDTWVRAQIEQVPAKHRRAIIGHDSFSYYTSAYGVEFLSPVGWSTDEEPSAATVGALVRQMRNDHVRVLFAENVSDPRLVERLAAEGEGIMGGVLYSDALSGPDGPASTYEDMIRHNTRTIVDALLLAEKESSHAH